jgi:DNA (cytosine-5)-methyltransferase 1
MSHYGVPIVRIAETKLIPHKNACAISDLRSYARKADRPLAIDLFCGAGGLSLGLQEAGFDVILGVDRYTKAISTHHGNFGGASYCGDLSSHKHLRLIEKALDGIPISLIAGGPPCQPFSRAGKNKIRSLGNNKETDGRRDLWRNFIFLVKRIKPASVLIENVPDLGYGENSVIFRKIVTSLEMAGYGVESRILSTWQLGVPQHRQRLIIVGLRDGRTFKWPQMRINEKITVKDAIGDLPPVAGGARQIELPYGEPITSFQRWSRRGLSRQNKEKIYDHLTRPVRKDDLAAFRLMKDGTLYSDLPSHLRRYRADIFDDKYKRLPWDGLSRSITAHIGKDGYWYIHPEQHRTLTVREAARIQTFPDHFRFAGSPSHAFRQIGEAVPPLLAKALGRQILSALNLSKRRRLRPSTRMLARTLRLWFTRTSKNKSLAPWRRSRDVWQVFLGTVLCAGQKSEKVKRLWLVSNQDWSTPKRFLSDRNRLAKLTQHSCQGVTNSLTTAARHFLQTTKSPKLSPGHVSLSSALVRSLEVARAIAGASSRRPVTAVTTRIVERVFGESVNGSRTHAELLIGRAVGVDETGRAYAALFEIGENFCTSAKTNCRECPLRQHCHYAKSGAVYT